MPKLRGIKYQGIPLPALNIPPDVPPERHQEYAQGALRHRLATDPEFISRRIQQLGLSEEDVQTLRGEQGHKPDVSEINPLIRTGMGVLRSFGRLGRGVQQVSQEFLKVKPEFIADEVKRGNLTEEQGAELLQRNELADARQAALAEDESTAREVFRTLDETPGLLGTTVGFEDLGEALPEAVAFLGSGGTLNLGMRAALVGAAGATTEEESRLQNTAVSGVLGIALPGALQGTAAAIRNGAFATRFGLGLAGTVAGIRGFGRATTFIAKIGGIARREQVDKATAGELRALMMQSAERLAPIIQRMEARQVKDFAQQSFRDLLASNFRRDVQFAGFPKGKIGLDVGEFLRDISSLSDATIRNRLGSTFGKEIVAFREFASVVAPRIDSLLEGGSRSKIPNLSFAQGVIEGVHEYLGSARYEAIKQLKSAGARERAYLTWFGRLSASLTSQAEGEGTQDEQ